MKNLNETKEKISETLNEVSQTENPEDLNENEQEDKTSVSDKKQKRKNSISNIIYYVIAVLLFGCVIFTIWKLVDYLFIDDDEFDYVPEYVVEPDESFFSYKNNKINIINPYSKEIIVEDVDWYCGGESSKDSIVLFAKNGKRGFCNILANKVIVEPTKYTRAWKYNDGLAAVEKDGYIGFINANGKVVIGFRFPYRGNSLYAFVFHDGHCVVADSCNKIGVINKRGHWIVRPLYDDIDVTKDYAIVHKDGDFKKQVDYNGNILKDGIIDYIDDIYYSTSYTNLETGRPEEGEMRNPDFYEYRVGNNAGLINSKGQFITPPIYTSITGVSKTLFCATLQNYYSKVFIDQNGNVISGKTFYKK